jgi:hypothetical protein
MKLFSSLIYDSFSHHDQYHRPSQAPSLGDHLRHLRQRFNERTDTIKEMIHHSTEHEQERASKSAQRITCVDETNVKHVVSIRRR